MHPHAGRVDLQSGVAPRNVVIIETDRRAPASPDDVLSIRQIVLTALVAAPWMAGEAILFYLVTYAATNLAAFGLLSHLETRLGREIGLADLGGLAAEYRWTSAGIALAMFSLAGRGGCQRMLATTMPSMRRAPISMASVSSCFRRELASTG